MGPSFPAQEANLFQKLDKPLDNCAVQEWVPGDPAGPENKGKGDDLSCRNRRLSYTLPRSAEGTDHQRPCPRAYKDSPGNKTSMSNSSSSSEGPQVIETCKETAE